MHAHHAFANENVPQSLRSLVARPPCWQDCGSGGFAAAPSFLIIRFPVRRCCYQYFDWIAREGPHEVQLLPLACAFVRTCYKDMYG